MLIVRTSSLETPLHDQLADLGVQLFNLARVVPLMLANASSAIFAFSAGPIFRLVLCVILRSACCEGTAQNPLVNRSDFRGPLQPETLRSQSTAPWFP